MNSKQKSVCMSGRTPTSYWDLISTRMSQLSKFLKALLDAKQGLHSRLVLASQGPFPEILLTAMG
jgi:hypothetical protein